MRLLLLPLFERARQVDPNRMAEGVNSLEPTKPRSSGKTMCLYPSGQEGMILPWIDKIEYQIGYCGSEMPSLIS
jgi:hypothetical protein